MAIPLFPPGREADLLAWSSNFNARINASANVFGLTSAQAALYGDLHALFAEKYAIGTEPSTNSRQAVAAKNVAKRNLIKAPGGARQLIDIIQAFPGTTDPMRASLGIRAKDVGPTPVSIPKEAPLLSVLSVNNRTVTMLLKDPKDPTRRAKPRGVQGATILTYVGGEGGAGGGEGPPSDPMQWSFGLNASKTKFTVDFPFTVAPGAKVWIAAMWFNARKETSPPSTPVFTRLNDSMAMGMAA